MMHLGRMYGLFLTPLALCVSLFSGCAARSAAEQAAFREMEAIEQSTYAPSLKPAAKQAAQYGGPTQTLPELSDRSALPDYLAYAAANNPGVEAAFYDWKAALEKVPQARTPPDPRVGYGIFTPDIRGRTPDRIQDFRASQEFPWFGKLDLEAQMALKEADTAKARYQAMKLKLSYDVTTAYADYYYLGRVINIMRRNLELLKYIETVARARYSVATSGHTDVIKAQVEYGKLDNDLRTMQDMQQAVAAKLNAALGRPANTPVPWPSSLPEASASVAEADLLEWLKTGNPELKGLASDIEKERAELARAGKDYYPDVMLEADYMDMRGMPDEPMLGFSINLPIWREKYRAHEAEAQSKLRSAQQTAADRQNMLASDLKMALYGLQNAARRIALYHDVLLPKGTESLKTNESAFSAGKIEFMDLIEAQRMLLEFEMSCERARADQAQRLAELDMLVGREISRTAVAEAVNSK